MVKDGWGAWLIHLSHNTMIFNIYRMNCFILEALDCHVLLQLFLFNDCMGGLLFAFLTILLVFSQRKTSS